MTDLGLRSLSPPQLQIKLTAKQYSSRTSAQWVKISDEPSASTGSSPNAAFRHVAGSIDVATGEPGWFAVAFFPPVSPTPGTLSSSPPAGPGHRVAAPFRLLVEALDEMVAAGVLRSAAREGADWACWSTVHGFADLATRGPLAALPAAEVRRQAGRVVEAIIDGFCLDG